MRTSSTPNTSPPADTHKTVYQNAEVPITWNAGGSEDAGVLEDEATFEGFLKGYQPEGSIRPLLFAGAGTLCMTGGCDFGDIEMYLANVHAVSSAVDKMRKNPDHAGQWSQQTINGTVADVWENPGTGDFAKTPNLVYFFSSWPMEDMYVGAIQKILKGGLVASFFSTDRKDNFFEGLSAIELTSDVLTRVTR